MTAPSRPGLDAALRPRLEVDRTGLDETVVAAPRSRYDEAAAAVEDRLQRVSSQLDDLGIALAPVLMPREPQAESVPTPGQDEPELHSPAVTELYRLARFADELGDRVRDLHRRLEL